LSFVALDELRHEDIADERMSNNYGYSGESQNEKRHYSKKIYI